MLKVSLFLHIVAAIFWIGGMLFLTLVVAPFLSTIEDSAQRSSIYQVVGTRYRFWGWVAIVILLITGPLNLYLMGMPPHRVMDPSFLATNYGKTLLAKVGLVVVIVLTSILHDFWLGPRARESRTYTFYARLIGRSNLVLALFIVILAVFLRTGGF